jgi:tRNA-specific 2-thiouridylase
MHESDSRKMNDLPLVAVGMSGGVDSSVVAALLAGQGYPVVGMMLRLWSEPGTEVANRCCTPDAVSEARRISARLGIPFYALDARDIFHQHVVQSFLDGYSSGKTPNPCMVCNLQVKWGFLLEKARSLGAEYLATGHYARLTRGEDGKVILMKGLDKYKDQSYFLSLLDQQQLSHTLFPLGDLQKSEVREIARRFSLEVASKPDSQDLCFLGNQDYRQFLSRHVPEVNRSGPIVNSNGAVLGSHQGLAFYTIGQRKGLEITSLEPIYVLSKDYSSNRLVVGREAELGQRELYAENMNWIAGNPPEGNLHLQAKIRYRAKYAPVTITPLEGRRAHAVFEDSQRDITPGQYVVFYNNDIVLGGGMISG